MKPEEITNYLDTLYKKEWKKYKEFHYTYFCRDGLSEDGALKFDEPTESEIEKYGADTLILCFRTPGYTIGHLVCSKDLIIKDIVVYGRSKEGNQFVISPFLMLVELTKKFEGKKLDV